MSAGDFESIAAILYAESGIRLSQQKTSLMYSRLAKRLRSLGMKDFRAYRTIVENPDSTDERRKMVAALTTNVTSFFREHHHFQHLDNEILPSLLRLAERGDRIRIWSAACSSGQEPYSIALTLLSAAPDISKLDIKILATDIDYNAIAAAAAGEYDETAMSSVPAALKNRWFTTHSDGLGPVWRVKGDLKKLVSFREINLIKEWPMKCKFHAIFCRNVVIYFDQETQSKIWKRFIPYMAESGVLYTGHSERIRGEAERMLVADGVTTYRLRGSA